MLGWKLNGWMESVSFEHINYIYLLKVVNRFWKTDDNDLSIDRIFCLLKLKAANKSKKLGPVTI